MDSQELKKLNKYLSDFNQIRYNGKRINEEIVKSIDAEYPRQGDTGLSYETYELEPGLYIRFTITTDSYGNESSLSGVQFVQPVTKTITSYEPIN